jgi:hypothetical protein
MPNKTTIEVHGPREQVIEALLSVDQAVELRSEVDKVALVEIGLGFATAFWVEADERTVITVHDPDHTDHVASSVFGRLAEGAHGFEICHGHHEDDILFQLEYAS